MPRPNFPSAPFPKYSYLMLAGLGVLCGLGILTIAYAETRWIVYVAAGQAFILIHLMLGKNESFLWAIFILALQFNIHVRVLYGYGGTSGFSFPFPIVIALYLTLSHIISGNFTRLKPIRWGGPLAIPIVIFLALSLLSLITSSETFVGLTALLTVSQYYLLYWIALNFVRTRKQLQNTLTLLFLVLGIQATIYMIQSALGITFTLTGSVLAAGELPRPGGTVSTTPAGFAAFTIPILLILISHVLWLPLAKRRQWLLISIAILGLVALLLTYTRAAWGAFILGILAIIFVGFRRRLLSMKHLLIFAGVFTIVSVAAVPMMVERMKGAPMQESYDERLYLIEMAVSVIKAHPVTGVGPGAYAHTFRKYIPSNLQDKWIYVVHNTYLLHAAEIGLPGGLAFILLLAGGLRLAMQLSRSQDTLVSSTAIGWAAGLTALAFQMLWEHFSGFTYTGLMWFFLGLTGAMHSLEVRNGKTSANHPTESNNGGHDKPYHWRHDNGA